jgi:uncharacterized protein (TIGR02145 family)
VVSFKHLPLLLGDRATGTHIIAGITYPPAAVTNDPGEKEFTVTFKPEVRELAAATPLTVKLYAGYKPAATPTVTKYAYLEIRVEDATCICPAKTGTDTWLNFMCHNLGGLDIISPSQLITYEHHGDWYRFGARKPSLVNTGENNSTVTCWTSNVVGAWPPYYSSETGYEQNNGSWNWPDNLNADIGNPCPTGWRLPTNLEWDAVNSSNNTHAYVPAGTWSSGETVFCNLKKLGDDLMLPANGYRNLTDGSLIGRGQFGYSICSTSNGSNERWTYLFSRDNYSMTGYGNRGFGNSVRCVEIN